MKNTKCKLSEKYYEAQIEFYEGKVKQQIADIKECLDLGFFHIAKSKTERIIEYRAKQQFYRDQI